MTRSAEGQLQEAKVELPDGRVLRCVTGGRSGPLVLFESGGGDGAGVWIAVQERLSRSCRTISYDRSGLGGSSFAYQPRTLQRLGKDLVNLLDAIGVAEPIVLIGHSWGGNIIRVAASQTPERVRGLMYIDPTLSATYEGPYLNGVRFMHWKYLLQVVVGGRSRLLRRFRDGRWPELSRLQLDIALADHWTARGLIATDRELKHIAPSRQLIAKLESHPGPIPYRYLVGLKGDQRIRQLMFDSACALSAISPNGSAIGIEDAGHSIAQERPRRTVAEIEFFIKELHAR